MTRVYYRAHTENGGRDVSAAGWFDTLNVPAELPELQVSVYDQERVSPEPYLMGAMLGLSNVLYVIDREGRWLWYRVLSDELTDSSAYQVYFDQQGNDLVYMAYADDPTKDLSALRRIDLLGHSLQQLSLPYAHHAFAELPDGVVAYLAVDERAWYDPDQEDYVQVCGDKLMEVDAQGELREVFSTWDWAEPTKHDHWDESGVGKPADWTHGNALRYYEPSDSYLLSLAYLDTVLELDRESGAVLRSFGAQGEIPVEVDSLIFSLQHDPTLTDAGTLLMASGARTEETFAIEYDIDEEAGVLRERWSYGQGAGLYTLAGGQASRLSNGNTLFGTGTTGLVREVTPEGEVVWEVFTGMGASFYELVLFSDFYEGRPDRRATARRVRRHRASTWIDRPVSPRPRHHLPGEATEGPHEPRIPSCVGRGGSLSAQT